MKTSDSEIGFLRKQGAGRLCPLESANAITESSGTNGWTCSAFKQPPPLMRNLACIPFTHSFNVLPHIPPAAPRVFPPHPRAASTLGKGLNTAFPLQAHVSCFSSQFWYSTSERELRAARRFVFSHIIFPPVPHVAVLEPSLSPPLVHRNRSVDCEIPEDADAGQNGGPSAAHQNVHTHLI